MTNCQLVVTRLGGPRDHGAMADSWGLGGDTPDGSGHRRVYGNAPGTLSPADLSARFGRLAGL
jgi:hypothetical protein